MTYASPASGPIRPQVWYRSQVAFVALSRADSRESVTPPQVDTPAAIAINPSIPINFRFFMCPPPGVTSETPARRP